MNEFLESLEPYVEERIQINYSKLRKCKDFSLKNEKFSKNYNYLYNKLSKEDKLVLENIYGLLNEMNAKTNYLAYEIGFIDGIKLNNFIEKN